MQEKNSLAAHQQAPHYWTLQRTPTHPPHHPLLSNAALGRCLTFQGMVLTESFVSGLLQPHHQLFRL